MHVSDRQSERPSPAIDPTSVTSEHTQRHIQTDHLHARTFLSSLVNKIPEVGSMVDFPARSRAVVVEDILRNVPGCSWETIFKTSNLSSEPVYGTHSGLRDLGLRKCGAHRPRQELPGARHLLQHLSASSSPSTETSPASLAGRRNHGAKRRLKKAQTPLDNSALRA